MSLWLNCRAQKRNALGWVWQNPLPQGNPLYSIHFAKDKETGFAVGADGTILSTSDGGFSWKKQLPPVDVTLSGVFVKDKKTAVIVGARGTILLTDNGGKDWRKSNRETKDHLYGVTFAGETLQTGWAVGTYGRILKTIRRRSDVESADVETPKNISLKVSAFDATDKSRRRRANGIDSDDQKRRRNVEDKQSLRKRR